MARRPGLLARLLLRRTPAGPGRPGAGPQRRGDGGAGVREPRRPRPSPPGDAVALAPPPLPSTVDLTSGFPRS